MTEKSKTQIICGIYIVECADGSYYTGVTTDLERRIEEHNSPVKGAKYTRGRQPVHLMFYEKVRTQRKAQQEERRIKKMTKEEKKKYIRKK